MIARPCPCPRPTQSPTPLRYKTRSNRPAVQAENPTPAPAHPAGDTPPDSLACRACAPWSRPAASPAAPALAAGTRRPPPGHGAAVSKLPGVFPADPRSLSPRATASWHAPSASSTCCTNSCSVLSGEYTRCRKAPTCRRMLSSTTSAPSTLFKASPPHCPNCAHICLTCLRVVFLLALAKGWSSVRIDEACTTPS